MPILLSNIRKNHHLYQLGILLISLLFCLALFSVLNAVPVLAVSSEGLGGNGDGDGGQISGDWLDAVRATGNARSLIRDILTVVYNIVTIVGVIFIIIGLVKFVIAHANEQGPEQHKSAMMMATGLVLVILPAIMDKLSLDQYINLVE